MTPWPQLDPDSWRDTRATLHLWTQIVGKIRLSLTPWLNHSWHVTLYVTARGLTTGPMPAAGEAAGKDLQIDFDFIDHVLWLRLSDGATRQVMLTARPTAEFYAEVMAALAVLGVTVSIHTVPSELADPLPFDRDTLHAAYDPGYANRFFRVLRASHRVMSDFRTCFLGKSSPVHFFWGSFDLAVTRFSGRPAPRHPGGVPNLPDAVAREAYSHEVSSAGFWPGGGLAPVDYPAFYSYAYPAPPGFDAAKVEPSGARFDETLGEFLLPYDEVRRARDPDAALMAFLQSTYAAAADLGRWDRKALECAMGVPGRPRPV